MDLHGSRIHRHVDEHLHELLDGRARHADGFERATGQPSSTCSGGE